MAAAPSRGESLSLLRSLVRVGRQFPDYNIREYIKRGAIDGFRDNRAVTDADALAAAYADGTAQLDVARREAVVYSLYAPKVKSIMDTEKMQNINMC